MVGASMYEMPPVATELDAPWGGASAFRWARPDACSGSAAAPYKPALAMGAVRCTGGVDGAPTNAASEAPNMGGAGEGPPKGGGGGALEAAGLGGVDDGVAGPPKGGGGGALEIADPGGADDGVAGPPKGGGGGALEIAGPGGADDGVAGPPKGGGGALEVAVNGKNSPVGTWVGMPRMGLIAFRIWRAV